MVILLGVGVRRSAFANPLGHFGICADIVAKLLLLQRYGTCRLHSADLTVHILYIHDDDRQVQGRFGVQRFVALLCGLWGLLTLAPGSLFVRRGFILVHDLHILRIDV